MAGDGVPRIDKLDVDNYLQWSFQIEHILRIRDCWSAVAQMIGTAVNAGGGAISATSAAPGGGAAADGAAAVGVTATAGGAGAAETGTGDGAAAAATVQAAATGRAEELAKSIMALNVRAHHRATFRLHPTARGVWEALAAEFRSTGAARMTNLRREMATLEMCRNEPIVRYFNRGRTIAWELQELGAFVDDEQLLTCLLAGLLPKFQLTKEVFLGRPGVTALMAQESLQATETRLQRASGRGEEEGTALKASHDVKAVRDPKAGRDPKKDDKRRKGIKCYNCNERGHISRECPEKKKGNGSGQDGAADLAMMAVEVPVGDVNVPEHATLTAGEMANGGDWVLDSGASHHMAGGEAGLTRVKRCDPVAIMMADGRVKLANRCGTATLSVRGEAMPTRLTLMNVLVVPGLSAPLFSIRQAAGLGYRVEFDRNGVTIKDRAGKVHVRGVTAVKLYMLPTLTTAGAAFAATTTTATTAATWHRRFGHLGATTLARTGAVVDGMRLEKGHLDQLRKATSVPCVEGKMTRAPFQAAGDTSSAPLDIIHSDTCGPMPTPSMGGNVYFTTVIDKHTQWKALVPHKVRGAAKDVVMSVVNRWETQTGKRAKIIVTDGARDYEGERWD